MLILPPSAAPMPEAPPPFLLAAPILEVPMPFFLATTLPQPTQQPCHRHMGMGAATSLVARAWVRRARKAAATPGKEEGRCGRGGGGRAWARHCCKRGGCRHGDVVSAVGVGAARRKDAVPPAWEWWRATPAWMKGYFFKINRFGLSYLIRLYIYISHSIQRHKEEKKRRHKGKKKRRKDAVTQHGSGGGPHQRG